jgi:microcystin-dependent protein
MSEPFLSEIKIISWNFAPKAWTFCNGQLMAIMRMEQTSTLAAHDLQNESKTRMARERFKA